MADTLKELSDAMANAVEAIRPSLVSVNTRRRLPATGIVFAGNGVIVTANHVVERDEELSITAADGTTHEARLIGRDPQNDLAVLQVDAELPAVTWGANESLRVGNLVLALGKPGDEVQATLGVVSALVSAAARPPHRPPHGEHRHGEHRRGKRGGGRGGRWMMQPLVDGYIQTDVIMYPGFSGGPLVSGDGAVHGLNTSGFGRGASLAVPVATIRNTVSVLQQHGKMRQGYLGIGLQPVRLPEQVSNELEQDMGLLVVSIEDNSPAAQGGVFVGDIVVALDGDSVEQVDELMSLLSRDRVGQSVPLQIVRGGQVQELTVTIGERG
ncbi:MAG: trypsin-like peptidase domain-containing protein [Anaerolineae bacterium]|nr:trypsin-like peptidase domain-containing protein [Anaerolineae bacterium]